MDNNEFDLYKDIQARTNGEIYIGVVGPVRTGKSTFIKRFMNLFVIPQIEDVNEQQRTRDELPQSAGGKGIWDTNIFGKTVEQLVYDGISGKIGMIGDESQMKLQDTMQKIVNDTNGGLICIIL